MIRNAIAAFLWQRFRQRIGADRIHAEASAAQVAGRAHRLAVNKQLVGGVEVHLDGRVCEAPQRGQVSTAAQPDARLGRIEFPLRKRLPAGFIECGRGPAHVVAGAPDALLGGDG